MAPEVGEKALAIRIHCACFEIHTCLRAAGGKACFPTQLPVKALADLQRRLDPLPRKTSALSVPPPRSMRFPSPLVLSRVHRVEPKLVAEITYLTWTADNLLRHTVYVGLREDNAADQVRRGRSIGQSQAALSGSPPSPCAPDNPGLGPPRKPEDGLYAG